MSRTLAASATIDQAADLPEALARVSFAVIGHLARLAAEEDLSLTLLRMLGILRDRQPRMAELASALGTDRSSTSGLIARAERRGFVARKPAPGDGRGFTVSLTPKGKDFAASLTQRVNDALGSLFSDLRASERRTLATLLMHAIN